MFKTKLISKLGHKNWVLCVAWSPDGTKLASACKNSSVCATLKKSIYFLVCLKKQSFNFGENLKVNHLGSGDGQTVGQDSDRSPSVDHILELATAASKRGVSLFGELFQGHHH